MSEQLKLCAFADESSPNVDEQISALQRNNMSLIELRNVNGTNISELTADEAKQLKTTLSAQNISVWSIGSPYGKINIHDPFLLHLESFKRTVDNAVTLQASCLRLFSFYVDGAHTDAVRDEVFLRMSKFADAARGSGLILCHENEKGIFGDVASRCLEIHKALPEIRCVFDPANFIQCGQDIVPAWEQLKGYVEYLHIKDALQSGRIVPAGSGIGSIPYLVHEYHANGGHVLTVEPHLKVFAGLSDLEGGKRTEIDNYTYKTNEAAFDAACNAISQIIECN